MVKVNCNALKIDLPMNSMLTVCCPFVLRMLIYQHGAGTVERIWPRSSKYQVFGPNDDNNNIVETTVTGM
jgi:hypothetical protein